MKRRRMKKYTIVYEVEIRAKDVEEAEKLAELSETKDKARLVRIEGKNEFLDSFYNSK